MSLWVSPIYNKGIYMSQNLDGMEENAPQSLVVPAQGSVNFNKNVLPDWICYENHPAYSELIKSADFRHKIRSLLIFGKYFLIVSIKRLISYELIPAHLRSPKTAADLIATLKRVAHNIAYKFLPKKRMSVSQVGKPIFENLEEQGICVVNVNSHRFNKIASLVAPLLEDLRRSRLQKSSTSRAFMESRGMALRPSNEDLFCAVELCFTETGIFSGIAKYLGRPVNVVDINPQINDSTDDFWRRFFPDLSIEKPSTAYCHRDASGGDVKVIIYLSDVASDNGAFSFTLGSQCNRPGWLNNMVQEVNDTSGFSGTDLKSRQDFSALPAFLRKKCAFGNDLQTDTEVAQQILASEWKITAAKGHAVIFDSKGIHRGGMVQNKERIVLTCVVG